MTPTTPINLVVLSYHEFNEEPNDYAFSRTYGQFRVDLDRIDFDWITIDDGHKSIMKACKMMEERNIRAKLFISSALIGTDDDKYCTWEMLWKLREKHDICNHSHNHVKLTEFSKNDIHWQIDRCNKEIYEHIKIMPRFFVPPWNIFDSRVEKIANSLGLQLVRDRITIKNDG